MRLSKPKLLLVDDEPLILEMFEVMLNNAGFKTALACSSKEAVEQLKSEQFDVLVSDVLLEDLDGFDVSSAAKKLYPNISTILITGAPNPIDSQRAFSLGLPYLSKPVGFETLLSCIKSSLDQNWNPNPERNAA